MGFAVPMNDVIPAVVFAYARPDHLARLLDCLKRDGVPIIYAFADGAKSGADAEAVSATRAILHEVTWCEMRIVERASNFGLGKNVLAGISAVADHHEAFVVWEDDLVCVPGTYRWMCAALRQYRNSSNVFSVSAWNHPRVTPPGLAGLPYFDRRAECWGWGGYARSWRGMELETAGQKLEACERAGIPGDVCGADLPAMAKQEAARNIWAVRWLYHHLQRGGICLRPPWSMAEHAGFDLRASNAHHPEQWQSDPLCPSPAIPDTWPEPVVNPFCAPLWKSAVGHAKQAPLVSRGLRAMARAILPQRFRTKLRRRVTEIQWEGDYASWAEATTDASGYDAPAIVERVSRSLKKVRNGEALFERDGVAFTEPAPAWGALDWILHRARRKGSLRILDFGGSLGSMYFQYQSIWASVPKVEWRVVEQPCFVEAGRREFADDRLGFFDTVDAAEAAGSADILIMSGVVQYLPDPHNFLDHVLGRKIPAVILDRTPITTSSGRDRLTVQRVPRSIAGGSYPCWYFDRRGLLGHFSPNYVLRSEYLALDGFRADAAFKGFIFELGTESGE